MHNKTFDVYKGEFKDLYPSIRYCNGIPLRPSPREWLLSSNLNYEMCKITDLSRVWLYIDLADLRGHSLKPSNWFKNYLTVDFMEFQQALNKVYELLRRTPIMTYSVSRFKAVVKEECGFSAPFLLAPLWSRTEYFLLSHDKTKEKCVELMRDLVQWTRTAQKVRLINEDAEKAAYQKFVDNDERLHSLWEQSDPFRDLCLKRMRQIIKDWHRGIIVDPSRCSHGSGASSIIATGRSVSEKCKYIYRDSAWINYFDKKYGINPREDLHASDLVKQKLESDAARALTVDKNIEARRLIGPQHPAKMWRQQGVRALFYEDVFTQPFYRKHMPIFDREVNRQAALEGSRTNEYATLDLSSASDSVAVQLVKAVYTAEWRSILLLNRSTCFDIDPERRFTTYATMGDASTFPVETEVIAACVALALDLAEELYREYNKKFTRKPWHVFGDDIVVQNDAAVLFYLRKILKAVGFIVNDDKSFYYGPYRESCGVEAYLGESIEPFYVRYKPKDRASRLFSLITLANHAFWRGYKSLRQFYLSLIRKEAGNRMIPFTELSDDTSRVYTPYIDINRIKTVFNKDIQELEYLSTGLRSPVGDQRSVDMLDNYQYYEWLLTHKRKPRSDSAPRHGDKPRSLRKNDLLDLNSEIIDFRERRYKITVVRAPVRLFVS